MLLAFFAAAHLKYTSTLTWPVPCIYIVASRPFFAKGRNLDGRIEGKNDEERTRSKQEREKAVRARKREREREREM